MRLVPQTMSTNGMSSFGDTPPSSSSSSSTHDPGQIKRQKLKELVRPIFQESYFTAEYCLLGALQHNQPAKLSGLYAIPSAQSPFLWFGVLFVHNGPWEGGIFRFTMRFPDNFPDAANQNNLPTIQFTGAYPKCHPLINPSRGNFDIKRYHKSYSRSNSHIWQLLKCIRKIFYKLEILDKVPYPNRSAAELYLKSEEQFIKKCGTDVANSLAKIYEDDAHSVDANYIRFTKDFQRNDSFVSANKESGIGMSFMSSHFP